MVLQYGHGLLGSYDEARGDYLAAMANENRWVLLAQDWKGMSDQDAGYVTLMLATDLSDFEIIPDRGIQGLSELILGLRFVRNTLAADPLVQYGGRSVIDPTRAGYYGNSQGAILVLQKKVLSRHGECHDPTHAATVRTTSKCREQYSVAQFNLWGGESVGRRRLAYDKLRCVVRTNANSEKLPSGVEVG